MSRRITITNYSCIRVVITTARVSYRGARTEVLGPCGCYLEAVRGLAAVFHTTRGEPEVNALTKFETTFQTRYFYA